MEASNKQHDTQNPKTQDVGDGADTGASNREKDPADWVTGDEPMTGAQASYLKTLSEQAKEEFSAELTKGQASQKIDALRQKTGKAG